MATGYHDDSNNNRWNFVLHPCGTDAARGIPAVGKAVYRTDTSKVQVCTATTPNAGVNGGGTWVEL